MKKKIWFANKSYKFDQTWLKCFIILPVSIIVFTFHLDGTQLEKTVLEDIARFFILAILLGLNWSAAVESVLFKETVWPLSTWAIDNSGLGLNHPCAKWSR